MVPIIWEATVILPVSHESGEDLAGSAIPGNSRAESAVFL
jgi:hypothetical protein